jgi:pyruvate,orthophosphate dikinase
MFYGKNSEKPLFLLRKMIVSKTVEERRAALAELYPYIKKDIKDTLAVMGGLPVTFRLLDPPLHEFVPTRADEREKLAAALGIGLDELNDRAEALHESNPMMGHRGVRLGITYPEISETQVRAILESAAELVRDGVDAQPEIMVPVVGAVSELDHQKALVDAVHRDVCARYGIEKVSFLYGTMIEVPRAALTADLIARTAEFFSFGTNDLTQMTFGFSRDDIGGFVPEYVKGKILPADPFQILDREGVGQLVRMAIEKGRSTRPKLKIGICGEHGGEPSSVEFCHVAGLNYVSCSPFRVPIARLAAAQAAIKFPAKKAQAAKPAKQAKQAKAAPKAKAAKPVKRAKKAVVVKLVKKAKLVKKTKPVKKPALKARPQLKKAASSKRPVARKTAPKAKAKKPAPRKR